MTMDRRVRALVVDDSAFARKVLREVLGREPRIEVVGTARDGLEALERVVELRPDVVTLDLVMPHLDGIGFLRAMPPDLGVRVVLVSSSGEDSDLVAEALQLGAVELVPKPTPLATDRLYELSGELVSKVLVAAEARSARSPATRRVTRAPRTRGRFELVVVGGSTGGPQAFGVLLSALPASFPVPVLLALHIPQEYTAALAARLDRGSSLTVIESPPRVPLRAGLAVLARGGQHLSVGRDGAELVAVSRSEPASSLYVPAVDVLFESAAHACGAAVIAVVLSGMGDDGRRGAAAIHARGGHVITQAAPSCVIDGMPRAVREAGLSHADVMLADVARAVVDVLTGAPRAGLEPP